MQHGLGINLILVNQRISLFPIFLQVEAIKLLCILRVIKFLLDSNNLLYKCSHFADAVNAFHERRVRSCNLLIIV